MNRYSLNWAMYLGHHWSYRRETGESQMVFNYYRAFTDYIINFTFGRGVQFRAPKQTEAIVPNILKRIWEIDNDKMQVLWEMGQQGGITGDCFVKVAYEEPREDTIGRVHPGRVRILPLNSSFCFPEFHPHDRQRLIRFKLKYRFWGTSMEGTRQVYTYTEILTDDRIEEYINDELIDSRENPLGTIPVVHIPNTRVSGSPWGLPDCHDIIVLNRNYNEVSTDVADIINYHAAPVTVITGAKASQLEKGAKKVWGGLPKEANVFNLEGGGAGLQGALTYLEGVKRAMHEMVGVPESALGQLIPISNTSGVALSIQFQPLMNRWHQKVIQYGEGLERINELVMLTMLVKEPQSLMWDENTAPPLKPNQLPQLDPQDPISYQSIAHFPQPLPLDKLIALNEIQSKMAMGLESKEGALRTLGEEFPNEKLVEIRDELMDDAKADGALNMLKAQISASINDITGMVVSPDGTAVPDPNAGIDPATGQPLPPKAMSPFQQAGAEAGINIEQDLLTRAYGTKLPQRRNPDNED
ncbi:MAG: phage portal protein [Microbacteriaceae bacterium]|nr:phage portal protein [Microbacteriaceae bacterium]